MAPEAIREPSLPIVDAHHHLWDRRPARRAPRYMLDEILVDVGRGHNVRATVFVECQAMYRADGPEHLRVVGETEFANGVAAMSASGLYGDVRICAAIVGAADLTLGDGVAETLEAHIVAGGGRFRGVRVRGAFDSDPEIMAAQPTAAAPGLYASAAFRQGFARLEPLRLSFDAWVYEPQLGDVADLARAFPRTPIVIDHVGGLLGAGGYRGRLGERLPIWRQSIRRLAACDNISMKLGGMGMRYVGLPAYEQQPPASSRQLADEWRPYVETCIEAFGPERCMFESNFPVELNTASYDRVWNAFKILAAGYTSDEKAALFAGAATRFYHL